MLSRVMTQLRLVTGKYLLAQKQKPDAKRHQARYIRPINYDRSSVVTTSLTNILFENTIAVGVTELSQCLSLNLTDALTGHIENLPNFLQGFHPTIV